MTLNLLRETMRLHLVDKGARRDAIDTYLSRWDSALQLESTSPLPCPDCYIGGEVSRLQRVPSPAGVGIVKCPACSAAFEFPDYQAVATSEGIWPTGP